MPNWYDITRDPEYQSLPEVDRLDLKKTFFNETIGKDPEFATLDDTTKQATWMEFMQSPDDTGEGALRSAASSFARGALRPLSDVPIAVGALTGLEGIERFGKNIQGGIESSFPVNPIQEGFFTTEIPGVAGQITSMLAGGGAGAFGVKALGGTAKAAQLGAKTAVGTQAFAGGTAGGAASADVLGLKGGERIARSLLGGVTELASEAIPFGMGAETGLVRNLLGESVESGAGKILTSGATEAAEEGFAETAGQATDIAFRPEQASMDLSQIGKAMLLGGAGGGLMGAINNIGRPTPQALQTPIQQALAAEINAIPTNAVPPQTEDEKRAGAEAGNPILVDPQGNTAAVAPEMWNEAIKRQITPPVEAQAATQPSDVEARLANLMRNPGLTAAVNTADSIVTTAENTSSDVSQATTAARNIIQGVVDTPQPQEAPAEPPAVTPSPAMEMPENLSQTITDSNGEIAPEMSVPVEPGEASISDVDQLADSWMASQPKGMDEVVIKGAQKIVDEKMPFFGGFVDDSVNLDEGRIAAFRKALRRLGKDLDIANPIGDNKRWKKTGVKNYPVIDYTPAIIKPTKAPVPSPKPAKVVGRQALGPQVKDMLAKAAAVNNNEEVAPVSSKEFVPQSAAQPITPQGTPTPATEGTVMPGGSAIERDLLKPYANISIPDLEALPESDWGRRRDYLEGKMRNNQQEKSQLLKTPKSNWENREYNENARINDVAASLRAAIQDMQSARPDLENQFRTKSSTQAESGEAPGGISQTKGKVGPSATNTGRTGAELQQQLETLPSISEQPKITEIAGRSRGDDLLARDTSSNVVASNAQKFAANIRAQFKADELAERAEKLKEKYYSINASTGKRESESKDKTLQQWKQAEAKAKKAKADAFAELRKQNKGFTVAQLEDREPFMAAKTLEQHGLTKLATDIGYVKQGDLYVFSPQTTAVAAPTETAAPSAKEAAVASVVQQPVEGSIPTVEQESAITAIESTEKTDVAKEAMRFLEADLTDAQRAKWTPEMFTAAQAFFDSGGKDFDSLKRAIKFPRVVQQAYLKADKEAAAEQTRREAADAAMAREVEKAEKEKAKLEADQKQREELGLKTLNSLIEKTRTNVVQGTVKSSDANQAVAILNKSGAIPNVLFTWIGTSKDFLADPANRARYPETWRAVSNNNNAEGWSENGQPIVFTNNVGVSDLDRNLAKLQGTTPEVAAVRRVILHENIHKGMFFLNRKDKMKLFEFLHRLYSPEELDRLAKSYDEYSDWRINQDSYFSIIEEAMTRDFDSMAEIPRDGIWAEFMQFLRDIWQKITGKTSEPTLKNYKDVFRLIRNSLKNSEKANADRLKNGGEVRMSMSEFISNVTPEQDAAYAKAVADGDMETAQRMVDEAAKAAGYNVKAYHGTSDYGFTVFDASKLGGKTGAASAKKAFFFTSRRDVADSYAYLGEGDSFAGLQSSFDDLSRQMDHLMAESINRDLNDLDDLSAQYNNLSKERDNVAKKLHSARMARGSVIDAGGVPEKAPGAGVYSVFLKIDTPLEIDFKGAAQRPEKFADLIEKAKSIGRDSVIIRNTQDNATIDAAGIVSDIFAILADSGDRRVQLPQGGATGIVGSMQFSSGASRIKSADPVTYDEAGNVIPLSRRFQSASNDIRFSKVEYDSPNEAAFNSGAKYETNDTSVRPYASEGYGSQRMEGVSTGDNSPRAQAIRKAVSESNWNELSPTQRAKALEEFGLQSIQSRYSFDAAILPVRVTNERTPKNRPASILSAGPSPAITIQFDTSGLADLLSGDAVTAFANVFDIAQEEVIHAAQHINIYNRWKTSKSTDSVGLYELKHYTSMINEVAKIAGDELRSGNPAVANIFTNAWNLYNPNNRAADVNDAIGKIKSAPEAAAFAMELSRMMLQMQRQDFTTETGWMRFVEAMKAMLADITNALRTALAMAKNGQVGKRLQDEISEVNALMNDLESASQPMASKVIYDSPNEAAFNSGAEVARNADYDERDKSVRSTIRAAYDLAPKNNGPSVPLDQLFDIAKQSMPDLTEGDFSQILQDLYEDSGALLQAGESPFNVTTPDGQRAGSVIIVSSLPTGAMASTIDPESASTKEFTENIKAINNGTLKAAFDGVQFVNIKPVDHIVKPNKSYEKIAIDYVDGLMGEGQSIEQIATSIMTPMFFDSVGASNDVKARQALTSEVLRRVTDLNGLSNTRLAAKRLEKLEDLLGSFWQGLGTESGGNQGQRAFIIGSPRYSWMFLKNTVKKELKQRRDNILNVQFGKDNATSFTQNSYENADMASTVSADEVAKDTINDTEWDLIKEGEQVFEGARKTIWERVKFLVARIALYARAEATEIKSASKASFTDAQRDELAAILTMPKAEREKAKAKDLAELDSLMAKLLGEESPTDTPTEKKKRNKRKEIIDTVEKRVKAGEPIEPTAEQIASEIEIAENKASQIVYRFEELYRQGFKNPPEGMSKKEQKDSIIRAFRDQVKNPVSFEQFAERLDALKVGEDVAERLFLTASRERADLVRVKDFKIAKRKVEIADKQASRLIYATEERFRQGSKDLETSKSGDSINKAFRDQVATPVSKADFAARLAKLNVSSDVAERLFKTAEREKTDLEAIEAYNLTQGPKALKRMVSEINLMRRGEEIPLRTPIPWRKLLSQKAKTVEEYRQRIFDAISANEELKSATPEQKARLAELFTEAWESNRKRILDGMQERLIREKEAKGELSKKGAEALQEQRMRMVEDINLGIFDNDEIAKIMAEKFGIKSEFTDAEREKIESLIEILQDEKLNRVKRNKAAYELLETLSAQTDIPISKLLANFWVSSVLSGMNTVFSIGMSVFSGMGELTTTLYRIFVSAFSNPKQLPSEVAAAFKTLARVLSAVPRQANRAWQYLVTGDQAFLDPTMNDALKNMDYASIGKNNQLAEQMAKSDKILQKVMGLFMRTVSRLLNALDLFNSGLTKEGSLSIVFRQLNLDPAKIEMLEKKSDLKAYKAQVIRDDFNGIAPKTLYEKALVDSYALAEMMKALDELGNVSENADQMAMQGAMTLDPSGIGGYGYRFVKSMMKSAESGADKLVERNLRKWDEAQDASDKTEAGVKLALSYIFQFAAYNAANLVGVRFARFAGNKFNQSLSFLPIIGALRLYEAEFDADRIRGKEAFTDMIKRNQLTGVMAAAIGYYVLKAIAEEPDDEKRGAFINGGWSNLTPEKKQQKLASGQKEYTLGFGNTVINYGNWPGSGIIAAIGGLSDLIRFSPDQWSEKTVSNKLMSATASGVFSALEVPALSQFQELFGSSLSSKDPNEQKLTKFARVIGNYAGGFVPRFLKDIDYSQDPNLRKYETLWEKIASHIPVYRRYEGKEYYDILGQQIQRNIYPGSREFMVKPTDPAYKVLGALHSRGIWLTPANAEHRMVGKGARRRSLTQEEADNYSLETGKGYKQMLLRYGQRALQMPTERAKAFLLDKADDVRDRALKKVYRGYTPAS